ncbi:DMT family transporter [Phreatobacter sp. AB_2022a]|uniref:DMT family transporter n=1 Tax=Phreatobacter sp. AB_2022a TaxID=3003134 RepID=UPI0022876659|nr:DMT family transporter [Phreatobacter sp. AB_2022a]MCZ0734378.1 DMT family transporter [Phreatobacter sp. AB_2022a]
MIAVRARGARALAKSPEKQNISLGIIMMLTGFFLFAANDTLGKWLLGTFTVGQIMLARSVVGLAIILPLIVRGGLLPLRTQPKPWLQVLRGVLAMLEASLFFWALTDLPLASVMTYYLAGPIYVTALSPWLLGEHVGWRRWSAVGVGFFGVVLALSPTDASLSFGALCALAGSFSYACFMVATRKLAGTSNAVLMGWQLVAALGFGVTMVAWQGWTPPGPFDATLLVVLGLGSLAGNLCVNLALKLAPASVVVPYQYTLIVWGILFGYLVFGEVSDMKTLAGAAIIVGAGLFIFLREQQLQRQKRAEAAREHC